MKKAIIRVLSTLLVTLVPVTSFATPHKFEIGMLLPLTGELASIGKAVSNGVALASERNSSSNNIEFLFEDTRYDTTTTLSSYEGIKRRDQVKLIYIWGSPTCMPVVPIAEKEQRPLICFSGDPKPRLKYVLSFNNPASDYAAVMAGYLRSVNSSNTAIIHSEIQFYESLANALIEQMNFGPEPYRQSVLPSMQEFSSIVTKLKAKQYQALALFLLPHQIPTFAKSMSTQNYHPTVIGADTFSDAGAIKHAHGILDKAVYVDMVVDPDFASAYIKKFGNSDNLTFAYNGYYFAVIMNEIFQHRDEITTQELLNALQKYKSSDSEIRYKESPAFGQYFSFPIELKKVTPPIKLHS